MFKQNVLYGSGSTELLQRLGNNSLRFPRRSAVAMILLVALLAFEIFNFDTTRFALANLLGPVSFMGLGWASILAIAFCAIDFAGLVRMFTPEAEGEQPKEVWYLMGAWLLGATMNAIMTWWAVSLTLLNHDFGNEVLSRGQLLQIVPIFVATLVWLTRILFIGALTVTGSHLLFAEDDERVESSASGRSIPAGSPLTAQLARRSSIQASQAQPTLVSRHSLPHVTDEIPAFLSRKAAGESRVEAVEPVHLFDEEEVSTAPRQPERTARDPEEKPARKIAQRPIANGRVRQRPPMPGANGFHARSRGRN